MPCIAKVELTTYPGAPPFPRPKSCEGFHFTGVTRFTPHLIFIVHEHTITCLFGGQARGGFAFETRLSGHLIGWVFSPCTLPAVQLTYPYSDNLHDDITPSTDTFSPNQIIVYSPYTIFYPYNNMAYSDITSATIKSVTTNAHFSIYM